jgi:hypothetical protein
MAYKRYTILVTALLLVAVLVAGCTSSKPAATTTAAPAPAAAAAPAAAPVAAATTPACPHKEVLTGSWDSREVGYASNHDVREAGVWTDAGPVPVTLTQKCWDVTGTYKDGDCDGTLTGKIEKNVFTGTWNTKCTNTADSSAGSFIVTMAADNQSFMGEMYNPAGYGPEAGFPPSWWAKKIA